MPPIVIPGGAQIRVLWQFNGADYALNTFGIANAGAIPINQSLANTLGSSIKGFFTSSGWNVQVTNLASLKAVGVRDLNVPNMPEYIDNGALVLGGNTADALPLQTALCVTMRTAKAGRSYRGRVYLFGACESGNGPQGGIAGPTSTAAVAFVNGVGSAISSAGMQMAVLSKTHQVATPVSTVLVRDVTWKVQRRRRH